MLTLAINSLTDEATMVQAEGLTKIYRRGAEEVRAVNGVSFCAGSGEFIAIVGPSGAGKSTLLQLLGAMDTPTAGRLRLAGQELSGLSDAGLTRIRREQIGFVFQHFGLLPTLSVAENVALPALLSRRNAKDRVEELLEAVGLTRRGRHRPAQLSGGEMQRAAIARALINRPRLLLADEPTGNLDSATGADILTLFQKLRSEGLTVIVVTHNEALARAADRRLLLRDGRVVPE